MRTFSPALVIALLSLPTGGCGETQSESVRRVLDAGLNDGARDGAPDDVTLRLPVDSAVPDATEEPEVSTTAVVFDGSCPDAADAHGALADAGSFTSCDDNPCGSGQFCLNLTLNSGEQIRRHLRRDSGVFALRRDVRLCRHELDWVLSDADRSHP